MKDPFGNHIATGDDDFKYRVHVQKTYHFKVIYYLDIMQTDYSDSGRYVCLVRNVLGVTRSALTLQGE